MFSDIRGKGLWIGCEVAEGGAKPLVDAALAQGLMSLRAGPDVLRFAPALNISDEEIQEGIQKLRRAILVDAESGR